MHFNSMVIEEIKIELSKWVQLSLWFKTIRNAIETQLHFLLLFALSIMSLSPQHNE